MTADVDTLKNLKQEKYGPQQGSFDLSDVALCDSQNCCISKPYRDAQYKLL